MRVSFKSRFIIILSSTYHVQGNHIDMTKGSRAFDEMSGQLQGVIYGLFGENSVHV